jgi:hypothetical protein
MLQRNASPDAIEIHSYFVGFNKRRISGKASHPKASVIYHSELEDALPLQGKIKPLLI